MQRLLSILVAMAWGLWLGGLVTVFIAAHALFHVSFPEDRQMAGAAAAGVFHLFERYQLGLAASALLFTVVWRAIGGAPRLKTALFIVFAIATVLAVVETGMIAPKIDALRHQALTSTDEFKRLHGQSMMLYAGNVLVLLLGGVILPSIVRRDASRGQTRK